MITPPASVPSFYTVLFEKLGSQQLMKLMAPTKGKDIEQVLITSLDISSDMAAMSELEKCVQSVVDGIGVPYDKQITFNPLYLPIESHKLEETLDLDNEGDISAVSGFTNPFIVMSLQVACDDSPTEVDAKVCFKQFELPSFNEMLAETQVS